MSDTPKRSATLLLVRDGPLEVLMVHRSSAGTFASAMVFPGGAVDAADEDPGWAPLVEDFDAFAPGERARRLAVIRETWEETAVLVAAAARAPNTLDTVPGENFREFVERSGVRLRLDAVVGFSHWVTPETIPRRFETLFYLARFPDGQVPVADGTETVKVEWVRPAEAVLAARNGHSPIIFPTLMNLDRLAESADVASALDAARARPAFTVQPVIEPQPDGSTVIVIPAEAGYSVTRFSA